MEFQAIIFAGGKGSRMHGLTKNTPKCLLPIGNKPMIWYPVRFLEKSGFSEIIIITLNSIQKRVEEELNNFGIRSRLNIIGFNDDYLESDEDFGTASALYFIRDKIYTDCIVVSCDLITNVNLQEVANMYRVNDASFLMLLYDIPEQNVDLPSPGTNSIYSPEIDYIGFDEATQRLIYFNPDGEITDNDKEASAIILKPAVLKKYSSITFTGRVQDAHLYFIKKCLIDYIVDNNKTIHSLKGDFLPLICRKQFSKHRTPKSDNESDNNLRDKKTIFDYIKNDELKETIGKFSACQKSKDLLSCYYYLQKDGICLRTNNVSVYLEVNKQTMNKILPSFINKRETTESVSRFDRAQISADSVIGEGTRIGDKAIVSKSIIGKNCFIGEKAKIINSVIFDSVIIGDNSSVNGSIICSDCRIQKCDIKNSIIEYKIEIDSDTNKIQNETYSNWQE